MRTATKKFKVYKFNELPEEIQEKVFYKWNENQSQDYFWGKENEESLKEFKKIFPIKVKEWSYGGWGADFINFEMNTYPKEIEDFTGPRLMAYIYNNFFHYITKGKYYSKNGKSRYSKIFKDYSCALTGYCIDDCLLGPIENLKNIIRQNPNYSFYDLMRDCLHGWLSGCSKDYEYYCSEEYFKEEVENNGWEFTLDGEIFN